MKLVERRKERFALYTFLLPFLFLAGCATRIPVQLNDATVPTVAVRLVDSNRYAAYIPDGASVVGDIDNSRAFIISDPYFRDRDKVFPDFNMTFVFSGTDPESGISELASNLRFTITCVDGRDILPSENLIEQISTRRDVLRRGGLALDTALDSISFTMRELYNRFCFNDYERKPYPSILSVSSVDYIFTSSNHALARGQGQLTGTFSIGFTEMVRESP